MNIDDRFLRAWRLDPLNIRLLQQHLSMLDQDDNPGHSRRCRAHFKERIMRKNPDDLSMFQVWLGDKDNIRNLYSYLLSVNRNNRKIDFDQAFAIDHYLESHGYSQDDPIRALWNRVIPSVPEIMKMTVGESIDIFNSLVKLYSKKILGDYSIYILVLLGGFYNEHATEITYNTLCANKIIRLPTVFHEFNFVSEFFDLTAGTLPDPSGFLVRLREYRFPNGSPPIYLLPFYISALRFYAEDTRNIRGLWVNSYTDAVNEILFSIGMFGRSANMYIGEICEYATTLMTANLVYVVGLFETLGKIGSPESVPLIEWAVQRFQSYNVCQSGIYALGDIGDPSSLDFVVRVMKERFHPRIKMACVDAIEKITKSPRSFISFVSNMGDLDDFSSSAVAESIERIWPEIQGEDEVLKSKISEFLKNNYYNAQYDRVQEMIDECFVSINGISIVLNDF